MTSEFKGKESYKVGCRACTWQTVRYICEVVRLFLSIVNWIANTGVILQQNLQKGTFEEGAVTLKWVRGGMVGTSAKSYLFGKLGPR